MNERWCRGLKRGLVAVAILVFVGPIVAIAAWNEPAFLNVDEAIYSSTAARMASEGLPPYVAGYENKPPLIFYVYAAAAKAFGHYRMLPVIVVHLALQVLMSFALGALATQLWDRTIGLATIVVSLVGHLATWEFYSSNCEMFAVPFIVFALQAMWRYRETGSIGSLILGSLCLSVASNFKQPALAFALPALLMIIRRSWQVPLGLLTTACQLVLLTVGSSVGTALFAVYFVAIGTFDEYWHWAYAFNRDYMLSSESHGWLASGIHAYRVAKSLLEWFGSYWGVAVVALAGAEVFALARPIDEPDGAAANSRDGALFVLGSLAAGFVATFAGGRFFPHYFYFLYPMTAIAMAVMIVEMTRAASLLTSRWQRSMIVTILIVASTVFARSASIHLWQQWTTLADRQAQTADLRRYLDKTPDDAGPILIWGDIFKADLYARVDRLPASRVVSAHLVVGNWPGAVAPPQAVASWAIDVLAHDLQEHAPAVIVDYYAEGPHASRWALSAFPSLRPVLDGYTIDPSASMDGAVVYRKREPSASGPATSPPSR